MYDDNYKEYKSKLEEFYDRYPDAKELFKRYNIISYLHILFDLFFVFLYRSKGSRAKGYVHMYIFGNCGVIALLRTQICKYMLT